MDSKLEIASAEHFQNKICHFKPLVLGIFYMSLAERPGQPQLFFLFVFFLGGGAGGGDLR